jgi:hypothetical protein
MSVGLTGEKRLIAPADAPCGTAWPVSGNLESDKSRLVAERLRTLSGRLRDRVLEVVSALRNLNAGGRIDSHGGVLESTHHATR